MFSRLCPCLESWSVGVDPTAGVISKWWMMILLKEQVGNVDVTKIQNSTSLFLLP